MKKLLLSFLLSVASVFAYANVTQSFHDDLLIEYDDVLDRYSVVYDESYQTLTSVTIPGWVDEIQWSAFSECNNLEDVVIENGVEIIGQNAFYGCCLKNLTLPPSIKHIAYGAFTLNSFQSTDFYTGYCENLYISDLYSWNEIEFDSPTSNPGGNVYLNGELIESLSFSSSYINEYAFCGWHSLKEINLENVYSVGQYAFAGCYNLEEVNIPSYLTEIGFCAFQNCENLRAINVEENNYNYFSYEGALYSVDHSIFNYVTLVCVPASKETVDFYPGTTHLGSCCFWGCYYMQEIELPETLIAIGEYIFGNTGYSNRKLNIPVSVNSIRWGAFTYSGIMDLIFEDKGEDYFGAIHTEGSTIYESYGYDLRMNSLYLGRDFDMNAYNSTYVWPFGSSISAKEIFLNCNRFDGDNLRVAPNQLYVKNCSDLSLNATQLSSTVVKVNDLSYEGFAERLADCKCLIPWTPNAPNTTELESFRDSDYEYNLVSSYYNTCEFTGVRSDFVSDETDVFVLPEKGNYGRALDVIGINSTAYIPSSIGRNYSKIVLPEALKYIVGQPFYSFTNAATVECHASEPPLLIEWPFRYSTANTTLYVPEESVESYKSANYWRNFANILPFPSSSIDNVSLDTENNELLIEGYYNLSGTRLSSPTNGVNIVKYSDGSVKKVYYRE